MCSAQRRGSIVDIDVSKNAGQLMLGKLSIRERAIKRVLYKFFLLGMDIRC